MTCLSAHSSDFNLYLGHQSPSSLYFTSVPLALFSFVVSSLLPAKLSLLALLPPAYLPAVTHSWAWADPMTK